MRPFYEDILAIIRRYPVGTKFTTDTVRKDAVLAHAAPPQHPNGWGHAFIMAADQGLAKRTRSLLPV